ncbi:tripartite ATP-independent transporter DctP family solute receptor [Aliiruegeria haliotis]|uniref:Tripartite ATP-independent transporter DctP family solute receptor n=1 Tax=Aliiruegeria haliotis TaxID=1280846 RepID=A0A2T0RM57_9RHOB|nr:TRAP transporter substrate-binding protein [Aliiruegeria haliotis]PRY22248.1 tripartite ATP-independent transporter DctP family solute receptor [Aliiruegeria haliotis]
MKQVTCRLLASVATAAVLSSPALAVDLKIGHGHTESHSFHLAMEKMAELLEEKAPGAFDVEIFANAQLGSEREMQEQLTLGTLELTVTGVLGVYEPKLALLELPFLFRDRDHVRAAQDSEAVASLVATLPPKGLRLIGFVENGFRNITNNATAVTAPSDVDGLKIRTPENQAQIETFKALGAQPTPMPFSELYAALRQGVVDGQENPLQNIYDGKLFEVQKHLAMTGHIYNSAYIVVSESFYQGLSDDDRAALDAAAVEAGNWQMQMLADKDSELLGKLKEAGMEVTEPEKAAFLDATAPAYDVFYSQYGEDAKAFVEAVKGM